MSSSTTKSLVTKQHHWTTITTVTSIAVSHTLSHRCFTTSFFASTKIGHGRFGSVHKATLPSLLSVALKFMDSPVSLYGEHEFHKKLWLCSQLSSPYIKLGLV